MLRIVDDGLVYYQFESLAHFGDADTLRHGIFTRQGGVSQPPFATLNVGHTVGDDPSAVDENYRRICHALDVDQAAVVSGRQVHGVSVALIGPEDRGCARLETDILLTDQPGIPLMQRFADCVPLVLFDPVRRVLGLAHAGWRGTVESVALEAVRAMTEAFGSRPADIVAGVGPSIGHCCYRVGPEVGNQVVRRFKDGSEWLHLQPEGGVHLDLWEANRQQLALAGVGQVEMAEVCTACHTREFFSHRAERGRTGRFGVMAMLSA